MLGGLWVFIVVFSPKGGEVLVYREVDVGSIGTAICRVFMEAVLKLST